MAKQTQVAIADEGEQGRLCQQRLPLGALDIGFRHLRLCALGAAAAP
jgi:hypothetical protein